MLPSHERCVEALILSWLISMNKRHYHIKSFESPDISLLVARRLAVIRSCLMKRTKPLFVCCPWLIQWLISANTAYFCNTAYQEYVAATCQCSWHSTMVSSLYLERIYGDRQTDTQSTMAWHIFWGLIYSKADYIALIYGNVVLNE